MLLNVPTLYIFFFNFFHPQPSRYSNTNAYLSRFMYFVHQINLISSGEAPNNPHVCSMQSFPSLPPPSPPDIPEYMQNNNLYSVFKNTIYLSGFRVIMNTKFTRAGGRGRSICLKAFHDRGPALELNRYKNEYRPLETV